MINKANFTTTSDNSNIVSLFSIGIGLSIFGYLNPLHSPVGHDFLVNVVSFIIISLSVSYLLLKNYRTLQLKQYSLSVYTWISLAILLCLQPLLSFIKYPDALIFPVGCLILVALVSVTTTTVLNSPMAKRQFINEISIWLYITLVLTFIIQLMQATNQNILAFNGLPITRDNSIPDRLDGNFGQANHAAYIYSFGICCMMYQLHTLKQTEYQRVYQILLLVLLAIFAVGISLTKSRAVIIMFIASTLIYFLAQSQRKDIKRQLIWISSIAGIFIVSYMVGGSLIASLSPEKVDATGGLGRIVSSGVDSQRMALTHKAVMIFKDYPITGIGWRNFAVGAIPHVDEMRYVTFSDSSHMIFTQIASELGIIGLLCLIPVVWLIVRSLHTHHSSESAMALSFVIATSIYACFEYPLWYFRFLVVFGLFLAMLDQKNYVFKNDNPKLPRIIGVFSLVFTLVGGYYFYQFWTKQYLFWFSHPNLITQKVGNEKKVKTASVFGFLNYNDMDLATVVQISPDNLKHKLALFDRVIVDESSVYNLVSYGQLLSFDGQYDKALNTFKTACRIQETKENCGNINNVLKDSSKIYPNNFQDNSKAYEAWLQSRNLQ